MSKKEDILNAAVQLFAERGFSATSTAAIARKADVAEGLIFHHFKNKEKILLHVLDDMMTIYLKGFKNSFNKANTGLDAIENIIRFHFRLGKEKSKEVLVLIRDFPLDFMKADSPAARKVKNSFNQNLKILRKCIQKGQEDGSIRELPIEETAFIVWGMMHGVGHLKFKMIGVINVPDLSSEVVDFCRRSLRK